MTALGPSRLDRPSHGLWSLWEMLELNAGAFYSITSKLEAFRAFVDARAVEATIFIDSTSLEDLRSDVAELIEHLETLNARISLMVARELLIELGFPDVKWGEFAGVVKELHDTLNRELSVVDVLIIEPERQRYFKPSTAIFGAQFEKNYLSAAFELDEAAKCLALGRPTASVFHLMRLMEIAVRAVAQCLSIPDPTKPAERNWGFVLGEIRKGIDGRWPTTAARMHGDGEIFDMIYASLDAVKNPWRNGTMHPANKYTDDEAEHIFVAVKGFMMKLASRCDENGDPKA